MDPLARLYAAGLLTVAELGAGHVFALAWQRDDAAVVVIAERIERAFARVGVPNYARSMLERLCIRREMPFAIEAHLDGAPSDRSVREIALIHTMLGTIAEAGRMARAA